MLEKLFKECGYSYKYILYLIDIHIDIECKKCLYDKGFNKEAKHVLEKYFDDFESFIVNNQWGNKALKVRIYDRTWIDNCFEDPDTWVHDEVLVQQY